MNNVNPPQMYGNPSSGTFAKIYQDESMQRQKMAEQNFRNNAYLSGIPTPPSFCVKTKANKKLLLID